MESINCIVETPKGSGVKYTYDHKLSCIEVNKVLPAGLAFPFDFGFITGTQGEDGDPLDVVIVSEIKTFPACAIKCRIIGMIKATQRERGGDTIRNDRYIAIPEISTQYKDVKELRQLSKDILTELENFFVNYNEQAGKKFKPLSWLGTAKALKEIKKAQRNPEPTRLVQLLLPLNDNTGKPFSNRAFLSIKNKLIKEFGGVTIYTQSPAQGLWEKQNDKIVSDTVIVYEVMIGKIDRSFWKKYKPELLRKFRQEELVIRQTEIGLL